MNILNLCRAFALTAFLFLSAMPALAQSLTTTYADNNGQGGILFDLTPSSDMTIVSFDTNLRATSGSTDTVEIYWRIGTVDGNQTNSSGWTLLGSANVVAQGRGNATPIPIGGLVMTAGQTYGIYLRSLDGGVAYTNADAPVVTSNADLSLTSYYGKGNADPLLSGSNYTYRNFNGTVYYTPAATTCASSGYTGTKLLWCQKICESGLTGKALEDWIHRWINRYRELPACALGGG